MRFSNDDRLLALNYSLYMIASSYVHGASCTNKAAEKHGRQIYRLLGTAMQYKMENAVIRLMDEYLLYDLPAGFFKADVRVSFLSGNAGIRMEGWGYVLVIRIRAGKKKIFFSYEFADLVEGIHRAKTA